MTFKILNFDGEKSSEGNYMALLLALGLLSEDVPGVSKVTAETELTRLMPKFLIDEEVMVVEKGRFMTAAFLYAVYKATGQTNFSLYGEFRVNFFNYLSKEVVWDALVHPGKHYVLDRVFAGRVEVEVICLASVE